MTITEQLTALKNLITVSGTSQDTFLSQSLNDGQQDFSRELNWAFLENRGSITSVADKYIYDLASDFDTIKAVIFEKDNLLNPVNWNQWTILNTTINSGTPRYFIIKEGKLHLYPATDAAATTTTLGAAITSAASTTITLASVDDLEERGRALIDSEVIEWQNIDTDNVQIKNCRRGLEGTTAATHLNAAAFTYRNIEYDYYKTLADLATGETSVIPARYHEAMIDYAACKWYEKIGDLNAAKYYYDKYSIIKQKAKADLGEKVAQSFTSTLDDDVSSTSFRGNEYPEDGSLTAIA